MVVVDCDIDACDAFPLASLDDSEVVIQVSSDPSAIKSAYGLIKRMSARLGRRSFSILVSGVSEKEAMLIYTNMAQASQRYLAVPLNFIGYVPDDEFVRRAAHQGRSSTLFQKRALPWLFSTGRAACCQCAICIVSGQCIRTTGHRSRNLI
jgi:flagellar biosynthesis protein FlhG